MIRGALLVAVGGAAGSVARYWLGELLASAFPWGTMVANVSGSFAIGVFAALTQPGGRIVLGEDAKLFLMIGVCGGYTTFSSFSLQTLSLAQRGAVAAAAGYVLSSLAGCLLAVALGFAGGVAWNRS